MIQTSARLLALLSLLQVRREWTGQELADLRRAQKAFKTNEGFDAQVGGLPPQLGLKNARARNAKQSWRLA